MPTPLADHFYQKNMFTSVKLPVWEGDYDYMNTLEHRLEGFGSQAAISFAKECLILDASKRPSASQLLQHEYFMHF